MEEKKPQPEPIERIEKSEALLSLKNLSLGHPAVVANIRDQGPRRVRLLDLGFVPGTPVRPVLVAPGGEPVAYHIKGVTMALRPEDSAVVMVRPDPHAPPHESP